MSNEIKKVFRNRSESILNRLFDSSQKTADLLLPLVTRTLADFLDHYGTIRRKLSGYTYHLEQRRREDWHRQEYQRFRDSLQYLRREGFLVGELKGKLWSWSLTKKGRAHLDTIKTRRSPYKKEKTDIVFVVSYDIPESSRRARDWLRGILQFLDFSMVHKSVWIGNYKIPVRLLSDLRDRGVFKYVHIFEVGKSGTLKRTTN